MKANIIIMTILITVTCNFSLAQFPERPLGPGPERIEKYKKIRLIEELNLTEEASIRFSKLYNAYMDSLREINKIMEEYQEILENYLQTGKSYKESSKEYENYLKEIRKILREYEQYQRKYWEVNREYMDKLKQLLNDEQLAKYFLFSKRFNKELREALEKMREDMPRRRMR